MHRRELRDGLAVVPVPSPTLPPATHTNAWLLGRSRLFVVDPAGVKAEDQQLLADAIKNDTVAGIFLTHHHKDHIGGTLDLQQRTGAPILCSQETAERVPFEVQDILADGDTLEADGEPWHVLHTPGHATGHLCLHSELTGDMVAGDMVAGVGTILLAPPEGVLKSYIESLERLIERNPLRLLPAHGPEIVPAVSYLKEYIDHRKMRSRQILFQLAEGPRTLLELAAAIYQELPREFHPLAAVQIRCHLLDLVDKGEAYQRGDVYGATEM